MRVSVIIPNYNHVYFLKQRIDSILNQTFKDFELIILDDCSSDNSKEVIESYRNCEKVSNIIYNEKNSGSPFMQWEKGIELATAKYVWIAESDDWCERNFLSEMMEAFDNNSDLVLAHCQSMCIRGEAIEWRTSNNFLKEINEGLDFNFQYMLGYNGIPNASGVVFKRSSFLEIDKQYRQMRYCGDWFIWCQICRQGKVFTSGKYLNYFNKHEGDVTGKATAEGLDFTEGNLIFLRQIEQDKPSVIFINKAFEYRLKRLETLKYSFNDPEMYSTIKSDLLHFHKVYNSSSAPYKSIIEESKMILNKIFKRTGQ